VSTAGVVVRSVLVGLAVVVVACNALTGVSDLVASGTSEPEGGTNPLEAGASDGGGADGATFPSCGTRRVCLPSVGGWAPVVLMDQTKDPCQAEYPTSTTLSGLPKNSFNACQCACAPVGGTCTQFTVAAGPACNTLRADVNLPADGGCLTLANPIDVTSPSALRVAQNANTPTSCNGTVTTNLRAATQTKVCEGAAPGTSQGCAPTETCVPEVAGYGQNCLAHDGDLACPDGLPTRYVLGVGALNDTRTCSACTCATDNCASTEVAFSTSTNCFLGLAKLKANGSCNTLIVGAGTMKSAQITNAGGCAMTKPSTLSGDVTFATPRTVCCQ
jgi:hypothetical protein